MNPSSEDVVFIIFNLKIDAAVDAEVVVFVVAISLVVVDVDVVVDVAIVVVMDEVVLLVIACSLDAAMSISVTIVSAAMGVSVTMCVSIPLDVTAGTSGKSVSAVQVDSVVFDAVDAVEIILLRVITTRSQGSELQFESKHLQV